MCRYSSPNAWNILSGDCKLHCLLQGFLILTVLLYQRARTGRSQPSISPTGQPRWSLPLPGPSTTPGRDSLSTSSSEDPSIDQHPDSSTRSHQTSQRSQSLNIFSLQTPPFYLRGSSSLTNLHSPEGSQTVQPSASVQTSSCEGSPLFVRQHDSFSNYKPRLNNNNSNNNSNFGEVMRTILVIFFIKLVFLERPPFKLHKSEQIIQ